MSNDLVCRIYYTEPLIVVRSRRGGSSILSIFLSTIFLFTDTKCDMYGTIHLSHKFQFFFLQE